VYGTSAYDALNPTFAPFLTYGPLHLRLGSELIDPGHRADSYEFGSTAMYAQFTRGGYIQPLYPTVDRTQCLDTSNVANDVDPRMEVWEPALAAKQVTETNSNQISNAPEYTDQARTIAAALWPRFTCCNYCAGSIEASERHLSVGKGFWPQLIPGR
jgi:hypothetical protein